MVPQLRQWLREGKTENLQFDYLDADEELITLDKYLLSANSGVNVKELSDSQKDKIYSEDK